ncbi:hypothetical protein LO763_23695 [Glycomyces sp. A-F 0318]|uniref:hypothetical protein n=1 Tax=Glycomyces amatae TaxID=2881355 RepID=UPI001E2DB243|nr:hypothetical protein [Glycomyces amatae]MCD0446626.1 hypothetical protein [Glycomyces amatae]
MCSAANAPGGKVPLLFGLLLDEASATERAPFKEVLGGPLFTVMSRLGPIVLKRYRRKVFAPR